MVFNSLTFLVFLAVVLTAYYRLSHRRQNLLLLVASYVFYGWWDWRFLGLLAFTTCFDYACAAYLDKSKPDRLRKRILALSIVTNLGVIGCFKYFNFFIDGLVQLLGILGFQAHPPTLQIILPVGISFYTFLSMSYTIDVYRRQIRAADNFFDFALYVSFFPHLVAGPIVRARDLLPQCQSPRIINHSQIVDGIWLCLIGFLKKIVIADGLAPFVNWGFSSHTSPFDDARCWLFLYAFAFQIYGDFSGYSDIARGLSKLMGFELPVNFKSPYLVRNPSAFWQHWHISLSVWLRDYLYIPLGGNRNGHWKTFRNLILTMLLGGLWHGAGLAYLVWGLYHGLLLVAHRLLKSISGKNHQPHTASLRLSSNALAVHLPLTILFFHLTCIGWLLFRAGSLPNTSSQWQCIQNYLGSYLWKLPTSATPLIWPVLLLAGISLLLQSRHDAMNRFSSWAPMQQAFATLTVLGLLFGLGSFEGSSFIYFQF